MSSSPGPARRAHSWRCDSASADRPGDPVVAIGITRPDTDLASPFIAKQSPRAVAADDSVSRQAIAALSGRRRVACLCGPALRREQRALVLVVRGAFGVS